MKILTKEEEQQHINATYAGGAVGGVAGLVIGFGGVVLASRRYHFFRSLTLPLKAFLVTSSGTFAGIIAADHASRSFQSARNPKDLEFRQMQAEEYRSKHADMSFTERAMEFGKKERYKIVGASWLGSMAAAFALVNRNKYLTGPQKLVQARVYAQFLTLGVLVASAAFEIADSKNEEGKMWETVKYPDPTDPEHKRMIEKEQRKEGAAGGTDGDTLWKEMVAAEEERLKERDDREKAMKKEHEAKHGKKKISPKEEHDIKEKASDEIDEERKSGKKPSTKDDKQSKDGEEEKSPKDKKDDKKDGKKDAKSEKKDKKQ